MRTKEKRRVSAVPSGDAPASDMKKHKGKKKSRRMVKENDRGHVKKSRRTMKETDTGFTKKKRRVMKEADIGYIKKTRRMVKEIEMGDKTNEKKTKRGKSRKGKSPEVEEIEDGKKTKVKESTIQNAEDDEDKKSKGRKSKIEPIEDVADEKKVAGRKSKVDPVETDDDGNRKGRKSKIESTDYEEGGKKAKGKKSRFEHAEGEEEESRPRRKKGKSEHAEDDTDAEKVKGKKRKTEHEDAEDGQKKKGKKAGQKDIDLKSESEREPDAKCGVSQVKCTESVPDSTVHGTLATASRSSSHELSSDSEPCHPCCPHIPPCCERERALYLRNALEKRIMERKQRFLQRWPHIEMPKLKTKPWSPPGPPKRPPPVEIKLPKVKTQEWVPPYALPREPRPRRPHIPPEEMTRLDYEGKLKKVWHNFKLLDKNKMILEGKLAVEGPQNVCMAVMFRALIEDKPESALTSQDLDDAITSGYKYFQLCLRSMKCYQGDYELELNQLLPSFYFRDAKYTIKFGEGVKGPLMKRPGNADETPELTSLLEERKGTKFAAILRFDTRSFLVWSPEGRVFYIFDPHDHNDVGMPFSANVETEATYRGAAVLRYATAAALVADLAANYSRLEPPCPAPHVTLTDISIEQREPLLRYPPYELDLRVLQAHCPAEWLTLHKNMLIDEKRRGKYPLTSLSAESLATSRGKSAKRVRRFLMKDPEPEPMPVPPVPPEKPPKVVLPELVRGEGCFFYMPPHGEEHAYGRDDMLPLSKSEAKLHSMVDMANRTFHSQYQQLDHGKWILRGTRHMASKRYYAFKWYTGIACCVGALGMLRRLRARAWNEDVIDETLDVGWGFYRESLGERRGPVRRLVLGEHKDSFVIRNKEYQHREVNVAVWGRIRSKNTKVFDLCRGIEEFFKTNDAGILQIPGERETAIWNEGGWYYLYHPWPADQYGYMVSLQGGGKACLLCFARIMGLCEHFLESARAFRRKPYSISAVRAWERPRMPEPVNQLRPVAPNRWVVRGSFHEGDSRFLEEHRNKQATATSIAAIAMAHVVPPAEWNKEDVNETLMKGDFLYQTTMELLEKMGISLDKPEPAAEEQELEPEDSGDNYSGMLAAGEVVDRFRITDEDCIVTEVMDAAYAGSLYPTDDGVSSLRDSLKEMFKDNTHAVLTAQGRSMAVWMEDNDYYLFDPHACDENGFPSDDPVAAACLIRLSGPVDELVKAIESNLPAGSDNSFSLSPVDARRLKLDPVLGAPQPPIESKAFEWIKRGTAAIMHGPRGEHSAVGKIATKKAAIGDEDKAGRTLGLPAAAAFTAAAAAVPPPHMHQDHMYNFLDAGADYYREHMKKTGRKDIGVDDLTERFELGVNTFSIELEQAYDPLTLRVPDAEPGEGGEPEDLGEAQPVTGYQEMKYLLNDMWNDTTKPTQTFLLVGDYHQLGVWMAAGGEVVVFDPAPTLHKGMLTEHRIAKGDELRNERLLAGIVPGEDDEMAADEGGGEEVPEVEPVPTPVPPEATPVLMVFASPIEFIDKLVQQAPLTAIQMIAPYTLYKVKVTNELTSTFKDRRPLPKQPRQEMEEGGEEEKEEEINLVEALEDSAITKYMKRAGRAVASVRGRIAQHENYFMEPQRDLQDAAISVMAIIVENIEPYIYWRPELIDSIVMYGDRLYTISVPRARNKPRVTAAECVQSMHLSSFDVKLETEADVVNGDMRAPDTGDPLDLPRGMIAFLETNQYGVLCSKNYCCAFWRATDPDAGPNTVCVFDPHCVGPDGRASPVGGAGLALFSCVDEAARAFRHNVDFAGLPGNGKYFITSVKVEWEYSSRPRDLFPLRSATAVPDEGYEHKVLTAYSEYARERTILRGSRPCDPVRFACDAVMQSAASAIAGACMSHVRRPHLWTRKTVDQVMCCANQLFAASICSLGYEFRPGEDLLLPLQVLQRFQLGATYVRYGLDEVYTGRLEARKPTDVNLATALHRFFEKNTHGILWTAPHAVAIWKTQTPPCFYMFEPHACGPTGLRVNGQEMGTACVLTFTSPKLMCYSYLQNTVPVERRNHIFHLYKMSVAVSPIKRLGGGDPPLVRAPRGVKLVPATSKVGVDGEPRRAEERSRHHPPGRPTCADALSVVAAKDKEDSKLRGRRNNNGWLVLQDGSQYLSAQHSIYCRKFSSASRGNQALACCVMAVAMSSVQDVCRWCSSTLDAVLLSGDQLYQDSYLHYRPKGPLLAIDQILRKFYAPGNCVCRVLVFSPRQVGYVYKNLVEKLIEFYREEKCGIFEAEGGFAVALFRTPRGYYMFDPADRDRYGRAVPPPCAGRARACFSQYPTVQALADKLAPNIPSPRHRHDSDMSLESHDSELRMQSSAQLPKKETSIDASAPKPTERRETDASSVQLNGRRDTYPSSAQVRDADDIAFKIYGMEVTRLRRLNQHEN